MKCPSCEFTCSDLRDICPKCYTDLRDFKRASNLPVTYPSASYDDLYYKLKGTYPMREDDISAPIVADPTDQISFIEEVAPQILNKQTIGSAAIDELFAVAHTEISSSVSDEMLEFEAVHFRNVANRDDIQLLFDISFDTIKNPELEKVPQEKVIKSEERKIVNEALQAQLSKVEQVVSAPLMSLKSLALGSRHSHPQPDSVQLLELAPKSRRISAFALDFFLILIASGAAVLIEIIFDKSSLLSKLSLIQSIELLDLIPLAVCGSAAFLILLVLYPFINYLAFGQTYGERVYGIKLLRADGRRPRFGNIAVRSMLLPISFLLFGYVPLFRSKQPFHDNLAKTAMFQL